GHGCGLSQLVGWREDHPQHPAAQRRRSQTGIGLMAFEIGTATDYRDLLDRFHAFITTNPDLVAANQQWQALRWTTDAQNKELILKAPGLAGTEEIYCGIRTSESATSGYYLWDLN